VQTPSPVSANAAENIRRVIDEQSREALFPCHNPANVHMRNEDARLQTFSDRLQLWSSNGILASPQNICKAGFFYLGKYTN